MKLGDTGFNPRWKPIGRHREMAVVLGSLLLFAAVFAFQTAVSNPTTAPALLYSLPIALLASELGTRAGLAAAVTAFGLFALSTEIDGPGIELLGHVTRAIAFLLLGGLLGRFAGRLRTAHRIVEANERQLQASLAEISDLYENAPCGYHSLDPNGVVIRINNTELGWLGYSREEIVGKKRFSDLITEEGREIFRKRFPLFKEQKRVADTEFEMVRKNGTTIPVLVSATAVTDQDGNFVMTRSMVFNLTERRRAERLAQLKSELELRAAELERSNAELAQFAHAASHDLAEPLRTVSSYVQLLANRYQGRLDSDAEEFIGYTVGGVAQMQALIDGLLAYSTAGSTDFVSEPVDCTEVVWRVLHALQVSITEADARITVGPLPVVAGDSTHLGEVFQNLISNAIRFANGETPRIHISAEREPRAWCFSVEDNGIGIEPHHRQRIFDLFRRLHSRQDYPGTGIGLTICKKIVERQGGGIWVEEAPEGGSIFRFTVPDHLEVVEQGAPGPERTSLPTHA
jgi:PAS domain S-box-containing protein